jgi:hypothetical protein
VAVCARNPEAVVALPGAGGVAVGAHGKLPARP